MGRGTLRIYLGASPGVGKTFAMLNEGRRRRDRGADVVVGLVETHQRALTAEQIGDLETIPRRVVGHRGTALNDMDVDAVLARRPTVVLVDEYAHTNAPGGRHEKRWQDVEDLLAAGIDVISTLNIQHLESLNDVVTRITGVTQRETVPDAVVRKADQIELVDMSPEALRRRMAHGNVYPPERIDAALANFFRPGNLGALRELALLWVADHVEESLTDYLADRGIDDTWETRERVVVGISGAPGGDALIRRAARMAGRVGGDLIGVHVVTDDGLTQSNTDVVAARQTLVESLGGRTHEIIGQDRAAALVSFAQSEKATQLVIGATRQSRWYEWTHGSLVGRVARLSPNLDIHVIAPTGDDQDDDTTSRPTPRVVSRRTAAAWTLALIGLPVLTALIAVVDDQIELSTILLVFLALVLVIAALGGRLVAAFAAIAASLLVNWYFVDPRHTLTISEPEHIVALSVFLAVALTVGTLVDVTAKRSLEARRARSEAAALARSAASLAADPDPLPALLEQVRHTFALVGARITTTERDGTSSTLAEAGHGAVDEPVTTIELHPDMYGSTRQLLLTGRRLTADDRRVVSLLADQLAVAADARELGHDAATAAALAEVDAVRTALLRAVSHDLRTPLSTIKALVTGLLDPSAKWSDSDRREALTSVDHQTDRLNQLVGNLLDASRLEVGALAIHSRSTSLADVVDSTVHALGEEATAIGVDVPDDLPAVLVDPALLERSLANLISNAVRHSAPSGSVRVTADTIGTEVHLNVMDRGPGIPKSDRAKVLAPFQRLGDTKTGQGVGLGLAITKGFIEAMNGTVLLDDTPGGGLTVTITLPIASTAAPQ